MRVNVGVRMLTLALHRVDLYADCPSHVFFYFFIFLFLLFFCFSISNGGGHSPRAHGHTDSHDHNDDMHSSSIDNHKYVL